MSVSAAERTPRALRGVHAFAGFATVLLGTARPALASEVDGAYGRLDGDLLVVGGAGVAVQEGSPALALQASALYLATAGVTLRYFESFGAASAPSDRSVASAIELRPLFLGRFALDLERGPARLDLLLDSVSMSVGSFWHAASGSFDATPGLELGAGLSLPILPTIDGPVLGVTGLLRFHDDERSGRTGFAERGSALLFTLSWQSMVRTGIVDAKSSPRER